MKIKDMISKKTNKKTIKIRKNHFGRILLSLSHTEEFLRAAGVGRGAADAGDGAGEAL